jgi:uncharacterized protein YbjT (DUF2867 family)
MNQTNRSEKTIVVAGATGKQGGAVARHLLRAGWRVRGLTRNAQSPAATALAGLGAEMRGADLNDRSSLEIALAGAYGVFSVQNFYESGVGLRGEIAQGKNLADAALSAKVQHFVQSTMAKTENAAAIEHFESKAHIEKHIKAIGLPASFIGTVWFMDNLLDDSFGGERSFAVLRGSLGKDRPFEMLAVDDIGAIAALMFAEPSKFLGTHLDVAGDRLTVRQMAATFATVLGRGLIG